MSITLFRHCTVSQYIVYCDTPDSWRYAAPLYEHVTSTDVAMMHCCCDRFSKAEPRYRMCLVWSGLNRKSIHQGWQHGTQIYSHVCRVKKWDAERPRRSDTALSMDRAWTDTYGRGWNTAAVTTDLLMKEFISPDSYCWSRASESDLLTLEPRR